MRVFEPKPHTPKEVRGEALDISLPDTRKYDRGELYTRRATDLVECCIDALLPLQQ